MSAKTVCQNYFQKSSTIHRHRANILFNASWSLTQEAHLTLTSLGRHMDTKAYAKHKIKAVDRLLGNSHLLKECEQVYKELLSPVLEVLPTLFINVDWSGCCTNEAYVLRAALQYDGRGIPLYNQVFPQSQLGSASAHQQFLTHLKKVLPLNSHVVIITDAGFATPWFASVKKMGWDFVSRVNCQMSAKFDEGDDDSWASLHEFFGKATQTPKLIGTGEVGKKSSTPVEGSVYIYKQLKKNRKDKSHFPQDNAQYSRSHNLPWVIVTSLCPTQYHARQIINIYKKRMQIEQNFRDDKNCRYGLAWRLSLTISLTRLTILLLIATIATFFLWWIGLTAQQQGLHLRFQANTIKHRRVLSFIYLGREVCREDISFNNSLLFYETACYFRDSYLRTILCT